MPVRQRNAMKRALFVILLVLGWGFTGPAASEPLETEPRDLADLGAPVRITSDAVESDHGMRWVEFTGNAGGRLSVSPAARRLLSPWVRKVKKVLRS